MSAECKRVRLLARIRSERMNRGLCERGDAHRCRLGNIP